MAIHEDASMEEALGSLGRTAVYEAILANLPDMSVFVFGPDLRHRLVAGAALARMWWRPEELIGRRATEMLDEPSAGVLEGHLRAALAGETRHFEQPGIRWSDAYWAITVSPLVDPEGEVVGGIIVARDVASARRVEQSRHRLEQEAVASARTAEFERWQRERIEFLAEIDTVVAGCTTRQEVMAAVAAAAVPRLGDWCSVSVFLDPRDPAPAVEVAHVDPELVRYARQLQSRFPYEPDSDRGLAAVMRTGKEEFYPEIDDQLLEDLDLPGDAVDVVHRLALRSSILVPIEADRRRIGGMTFVISGPDRRYSPDDLTLARAVAGRVGAALENRRLREAEREVARTLQESLLPRQLPAIPGVDVAVRYWAAREGTQVGGDFYDVFSLDGGRFAVVIGDVCGTGPAAAAVTASARHSIRSAAWRGDDHLSVLRHANQALRRSWPDTFCTVVYATVEPLPSGPRLTVASGGHPLPVLVRAGAEATTLGRPGHLLGVFDEVDHVTAAADLRPGDTVVFYTDGAYDLPPPRHRTAEQLVEMLADAAAGTPRVEAAGSPLAEPVADRIAAALAEASPFDERTDDTAVLVLCAR